MSSERLIYELQAVGLPCVGMRDGRLIYERGLTPADRELADLVAAHHIEDDAEYVNAALEETAATLMNAVGAAASEWTAYRNLQKSAQAQRAGLPEWALRLLDALADGKDLAAIQTAVKNLRDSRLSQ